MTRSIATLCALALVSLAGALAWCRPEIPMKSPEVLARSATHVVTGEVRRVYEADEETEGKWRYRRCVAEVLVDAVEKGEGPAPGEVLFVRWFTRSWSGGRMPPSSTGHHGWTPEGGERVRVYLARDANDGFEDGPHDGGHDVLVPNGFEDLPAADEAR